jgi:hypothetical protein
MSYRMRSVFAVGAALIALVWGTLLPGVAAASVPAAGLSRPNYYLISLDKASLDEAVEAVLVQSLRSRVVVDPDLDAEITFRVAESLSTTELAEQFSVALAEEGVALVRSGDGYRLMDLQSALARRPRLDIVSVPPPEMRPDVRSSIPLSEPSTAIAATVPVAGPVVGGRAPSVLLLPILVVFAGAAAWLLGRRGQLDVLRRVLDRRLARRESNRDRDAVIDRLLAIHPIDLSVLGGACAVASRRGWPVEQVLCDLGGVSDGALADAYADVTGLQRWQPAEQPPIATGSGPERLIAFLSERALALIEADEWAVTVVTSDPLDHAAFAEISRLSARMVTLVVAARSELTHTPFRDTGSDNPPLDRLIIPWAGRRDMDGAVLLQAILNRRPAQPPAN